jgi:hypothetical protein
LALNISTNAKLKVIRSVHLQRRLDTVALSGAIRMDFDIKLAAALVIDQIPLLPGPVVTFRFKTYEM